MPIVADASVAIRGDMSGFDQDLKRAEGTTQGFAGRIKNILSPRNVIGAAGLFGIGLGVRQLVGYAGDAAAAFSELQQTQRTTDEVFGESAKVIEDWATRSADAAGMSQRTVFQSAAVMGQTLLNMGFAADEAAEKTVMLQQRAAEMGIAFGQTPERAILAITAAMRGERDTIEKFGVSIKQVDVNSRVAAMGLDTSTAAAKKNAEAVAILGLVMDQTANLAGRFGESQDEVADDLLKAQAKIDDFMTRDVGAAVASIQLGAIKVGEAVGGVAEDIGMTFDNIFSDEKNAQLARLAETAGVSIHEMRRIVQVEGEAMSLEWEESLSHMVAVSEGAGQELGNAGERIGKDLSMGLERSAGEVTTAAELALRDPVFAELLATEEAAGKSGFQVVIEYAKGLLRPQTDVQVAIEAALQVAEDEMTRTEEFAYLSGQQTILEEARGLASAQGKQAAVVAIDAALDAVQGRMDQLKGMSYTSGYGVVTEYSRGMWAGMWQITSAAQEVANRVSSTVRIESEPPDHNSPLYGITTWGGNLVDTYAGGIFAKLGTASSAAAALAGALVPSVRPSAMGSVAAGAGGNGPTYILEVNGERRVVGSRNDVLDAWDQLERVGA